jgi:hypothetical protein
LLNTADGNGGHERSSSMMHVVLQLSAQHVWMRWSLKAFAARQNSRRGSNCSYGSYRC